MKIYFKGHNIPFFWRNYLPAEQNHSKTVIQYIASLENEDKIHYIVSLVSD